ncbi:hypothetical protein G6F66_014305 [Rhizopus arrhizus]|nr:hypothetical protein G6F66_014305 [Rhizopus arrhizus]
MRQQLADGDGGGSRWQFGQPLAGGLVQPEPAVLHQQQHRRGGRWRWRGAAPRAGAPAPSRRPGAADAPAAATAAPTAASVRVQGKERHSSQSSVGRGPPR